MKDKFIWIESEKCYINCDAISSIHDYSFSECVVKMINGDMFMATLEEVKNIFKEGMK